MAYFEIHAQGEIVQRKKNEYASFKHDLLNCIDHAVKFDMIIVNKKEVTAQQAIDLCDALHEEWLEKKNQTHKKVMVSVGATNLPNTYRSVWVRR